MPWLSASTTAKISMKKFAAALSLLILLSLVTGCGVQQPAPSETTPATTEATLPPYRDYVPELELNMASETVKLDATVKLYVDGDTVHFHVDDPAFPSGLLKARFLAINTPESTGKIEEYGKAASRYTREKLSAATSIILESDNEKWNADSTGDRYLVWVWYRNSDSDPYRCLNLEILQEGLAIANSTANNRYGSICTNALTQARTYGKNLYSGEKDPDFFYGEAQELTLRELRTNVERYSGTKVAFNGIITMNDGGSVYVENYDEETGLYYGISVYYGYGLPGAGLDILSVGNEARIVGTVQYYEAGGTWQVSGLSYRQMVPDDPGNIQKISDGHEAAYTLTDPAQFVNGTVELETAEGTKTFPYAQLVLSTSVSIENLEVVSVYTTNDAESSSNGAMTLTCKAPDGTEISVRTAVLWDDAGNMVTADAYAGKTIHVQGIVDYFDGTYQIKVFTPKGITVQ